MEDNQTALTRLLDESSIRAVIARFAEAAMAGDYHAFRSCWAEDGDWSIGKPNEMNAEGADEIVAALRKLREGKDFFVQFAAPGVIQINGDTATTRCICHEAGTGSGGVYFRTHCFSVDQLRRSGDGWVFTGRAFHFLWLDTSPFGGQAFSVSPADLR